MPYMADQRMSNEQASNNNNNELTIAYRVDRPRKLQPKFVQGAIDKHRNSVLKDKNTGNLVTNRYLIDLGTQTEPESWIGTGTGPVFAQKMVAKFADFHPENTKISVLIKANSNQDAYQSQIGRTFNLVTSLLNSFIEDEEQRRNIQVCCNCQKEGHALIDYVGPYSQHGDIYGCVLCNKNDHPSMTVATWVFSMVKPYGSSLSWNARVDV